jgi:hypothetical protein
VITETSVAGAGAGADSRRPKLLHCRFIAVTASNGLVVNASEIFGVGKELGRDVDGNRAQV